MPTRDGEKEPSGRRWMQRGLGRYRWLLPPLILLAFAGFVALAAVHVVATLHPGEPWALLGFLSFPVLFPIWGVTVIEAGRLGAVWHASHALGWHFEWSRALRGLRRWEAVTAWIVAGGLVLGTVAGFIETPAKHGAEDPYPIASLVPMSFFGIAALLLLSAWRIPPDAHRPPKHAPEPDRA